MNQRKSPRAALLAACFGLIAACGGGTDGTGSPAPSAVGITTSGVMTKGSVIVNGVRFDDFAATVGAGLPVPSVPPPQAAKTPRQAASRTPRDLRMFICSLPAGMRACDDARAAASLCVRLAVR